MPPLPDREPLSLDKIVAILFQLSLFEEEYPDAAFAEVTARPDEFIPHLLEMLEELVDDPESALNIPGDDGYLAAMYLLAQFRETQALPLLAYRGEPAQHIPKKGTPLKVGCFLVIDPERLLF